MTKRRTIALALVFLFGSVWAVEACSSAESVPVGSAGQAGAGGSPSSECRVCSNHKDCQGGICVFQGGDQHCSTDCKTQSCPSGRVCTPTSDYDGTEVQACLPIIDPCGSAGSGGSTQPPVDAGSDAKVSDASSDAKHPDADAADHPDADGGDASNHPVGDPLSPQGASLNRLSFAVVGDTRPSLPNNLAPYPSDIINQIFTNIEQSSEKPVFTVATGDYVFVTQNSSKSVGQLDLYLTARSKFSGLFFPSLGNHECTTATASNCGAGQKDGETVSYKNFMSMMLMPLGIQKPYYAVRFHAPDNKWTAKFVVVAPNAWSSSQGDWLEAELSKPTTYTFLVRHEASVGTGPDAPGFAPSQAIIAKHPFALIISGHTHKYEHLPATREMIVGIGGAPITGGFYGHVSARQLDNGSIQFAAHEYKTLEVKDTFVILPDGSPAP